MLQQYQMIGEIFLTSCKTLLRKNVSIAVLCKCMDWNIHNVSGDFRSDAVIFRLFKVFSLRLQHI